MWWFTQRRKLQLYFSFAALSFFSGCSSTDEIIFPEEKAFPSRIVTAANSTDKLISDYAAGTYRLCDKLCIPLDLCSSLFIFLENPTPWKIKLLQERTCGFSRNGDPMVLCDDALCRERKRRPNKRNATDNTAGNGGTASPLPVESTFHTFPKGLHSPAAVEKRSQVVQPYQNEPRCGFSIPARINGGEEVIKGEFPWVTALAIQTSSGPQILCAGTLLSDQWVITAGHCVVDNFHRTRNISYVRIGAHDLMKDEEGAENVEVDSVFYHPLFRERPVIKNDIALLKLAKKIIYSGTIAPICLPTETASNPSGQSHSNPKHRAFIAGWGGNGVRARFNILQKVDIPLIPMDTCKKSLKPLRILVNSESQICGGAINQDSCKGDSGGPLMETVNSVTTLLGIISFGTINCDGSLPGVYTRVENYMSWIGEIISSNS